MKKRLKIIVIGGGAAGFFGGINIAKNHPNMEVIILEAGSQPLAKVKISGGGRCNVTHHCFNPEELVKYYPRGAKELRGAFSRFQPQDTVKWFENKGIKLKTEADGRMFPVTDNSQTIIDCLTKTVQNLGIKILTRTPVTNVSKLDNQFLVELKSGQIFTSDYLLIATGGNPLGYRWAKSLGHTIQKPVPSLFTFKINDSRLHKLAGVTVKNVEIQLLNTGKIKLKQSGPLLITHWGISGPAVLKLSAWGARILHENNYQLPMAINWLPNYNQESLSRHFSSLKQSIPKQKITNYNQFSIPKRLWQRFVNNSGIEQHKTWSELAKKELYRLVQEVTRGIFQIQGKGIFKEEFVTCGGVTLKEINFKTMESKICPSLYFAGEILDIDGVTGGFNFQSAWTTAWLAAQLITNKKIEK